MSTPHHELNQISDLIHKIRMGDAQTRLHNLIFSLEINELNLLLPELQVIIQEFFPKRRRQLNEALESKLNAQPFRQSTLKSDPETLSLQQTLPEAQQSPFNLPQDMLTHQPNQGLEPTLSVQPSSQSTSKSNSEPCNLQQKPISVEQPSRKSQQTLNIGRELQVEFIKLSDHYMFQWKTSYRDIINNMFSQIEDLVLHSDNPTDVSRTVSHEFAKHAYEIFGKGFTHSIENEFESQNDAISKLMNDLQKFLEIPVEFYLLRVVNIKNKKEAKAVRATCSSMLSGILEGFGQVQLGDSQGWKSFLQYPRTWVHFLGFLNSIDIDCITSQLGVGSFRDALRDNVVPVIRAIGQLIAYIHEDQVCLPTLSEFTAAPFQRLEISLLLPPSLESKRYLEIHCYLRQQHADQSRLAESANRGVTLIAAPLRPDLQDWVNAHEFLRANVVNTTLTGNNRMELATQQATEILTYEFARYSTSSNRSAPLRYNFAKDFPLHNPVLNTYFYVHRESVRNLLRTFERRNGVRLWCSVRRSGKTTATFDLGATAGASNIITQTCDNTDQYPNSGIFHAHFTEAMKKGEYISTSFFMDTVTHCLRDNQTIENKIVFVLDEYETLFETMGAAIRRDRELRYTIVQPLLNQMVAFSRQNLLVLIGQRPDAHYIIMDQNQLSPYVEQDIFPLFEHTAGATNSEFRILLKKILTSRVEFDDSFVDAVYLETGGHPWLTVNLLVDFFDWLIENDHPVTALSFTALDFNCFAELRLTTSWISTYSEYSWFRQAISHALSEYGKDWVPWVYAVYCTMRKIIEENPGKIACSRSRFEAIVDELKLRQEFGYTSDYILSTAIPANFLSLKGDQVEPRIRLMARIALATHPKPVW
jgi:hypothetical protein